MSARIGLVALICRYGTRLRQLYGLLFQFGPIRQHRRTQRKTAITAAANAGG